MQKTSRKIHDGMEHNDRSLKYAWLQQTVSIFEKQCVSNDYYKNLEQIIFVQNASPLWNTNMPSYFHIRVSSKILSSGTVPFKTMYNNC